MISGRYKTERQFDGSKQLNLFENGFSIIVFKWVDMITPAVFRKYVNLSDVTTIKDK